ncbi:MAG: DsrE family protein [Betaproteobacteria bacterium]|nr:DsrE family protein [Betaproteobacteria bacterium]
MRSFNHFFAVFISLALASATQPALGAAPDPFALKQPQVISIAKRAGVRVAYDVKDDVWDAGIGKGLYYVRGLLESYKALGVAPKNLKISIVLHGNSAYWLLNETAYRQHKNDPFDFNPNEKVVEELLAHGVSVEICGSTMRSKGWVAEDLLPGVTIVRDAYTRLIDLQQRGYAYIRF